MVARWGRLRMEEEPSQEGTALTKSRGGECTARFRKYEQWGWEALHKGQEPVCSSLAVP